MKEKKLLRRATSLLLALAMLFSFPVGAYSDGAGSDLKEAPEIPEGYVWRALSVELAPFEEDRMEEEDEEAARMAEKVEEINRFMELMLVHETVAEEGTSEPAITVRGWMPEDVTAQAEIVSYDEKDLYAELALMQVELRFYDGEGQSWTPAVPVTVCVDGAAVRDARAADMDPTVYIYQEQDEEALEDMQQKRALNHEEEIEQLFSVEAFSAARSGDQEKDYDVEQDALYAEVVECALEKDDEYPDAVCFETEAEALRFAVTARQQDRQFTAATEEGETEIVVVGTLPRDLDVQISEHLATREVTVLPGDTIAAWDFSLSHPDAEDYALDGSVKVALRDAALAESENEDWELQLWQLDGEDGPVRVKNAVFSGEDLRFSTDELSSFAVVRVALERCLTASDGNTYSVRVSYDSRAGIPADAELQVRELTDDEYQEYLSKSANYLSCEEDAFAYARFFDITIEKDGVVYEPNQAVSVSVELADRPETQGELRVVHFAEEGTELLENNVNEDGVLKFDTNSFSVYGILDGEGNITVGRVRYEFYDINNELVDEEKNGVQYILSDEKLIEPGHLTMDGKGFIGWYILNEDGSFSSNVIDFDTAISVKLGDSPSVSATEVTVPRVPSKDADGNLITYYTVKVKERHVENYTSITFHETDGSSHHEESIEVPSNGIYTIPDMSNAKYSIESNNNNFTFYGWSTSQPRGGDYYNAQDNRESINTLRVRKGQHYDLYPIFKRGYWLYFNTAPIDSAATKIDPVFVAMGSRAKKPKPDPSWEGRVFAYWTVTPTYDKDTGVLYQSQKEDEDNYLAKPSQFDFNTVFNSNLIPEDQHSFELYAYWEPGPSSYTIVVWKQSVEDLKDAFDRQKTYVFDSQYTITAETDSDATLIAGGIDYTKLDTNANFKSNFIGFHHKTNQNSEGDVHVDTVGAKVAEDGSTVVNVYYDRNLIFMKFYQDKDPGKNSQYYNLQSTTDNAGEQYALVNNEYIPLHWDDNQKKWYLNGDEFKGTRYKQKDKVLVYSGLFGQNLDKYYDEGWPNGIWYYYNTDPTYGYSGMSFLGQFVLPDDVIDTKLKEMRLYKSGNANMKVYIYLQNPDGSYPETTKISGGGNARSFTFSEKYEGYHLFQYRRQYHGYSDYYDADWKTATENLNVSTYVGGYYLDVHIKYARQNFTINYYDAENGKAISALLQNGTTVTNVPGVLYGADIGSYYPDASFVPDAEHEGKHFTGRWYADRECTRQVFFRADRDEQGQPIPYPEDEAKLWYYETAAGERIYVDRVITDAENEDGKYKREEALFYETMPIGNLALYAGYADNWYWVKIDPQGGSLNNDDPDLDAAVTYLRIKHGQKIPTPEAYDRDKVSRKYVRDQKAGEYYYHYDEFDFNDPDNAPSTRKAYYTKDASLSTSKDEFGEDIRYRLVPDEVTDEGYGFIGWYKVTGDETAGNQGTSFSFKSSITEDTTIIAKWSTKGNYRVYYSTDHAVDEFGNRVDLTIKASDVPNDENRYAGYSEILILPSEIYAEDADGVKYELVGWYYKNNDYKENGRPYVVSAGNTHQGNPFNVAQHPVIDASNRKRPRDTFIFYPCFEVAPDNSTDSSTTSLILHSNGGEKDPLYDRALPNGAEYGQQTVGGSTADIVSYPKNILLNMDLLLPEMLPASDQQERNVFRKDNSDFLGWSPNPSAVTPDLKPGELVGINNRGVKEVNTLYAVWRMKEVELEILLQDFDALEPISGGIFTLKDSNGGTVSGVEGELVSNEDGYLEKDGTISFKLKTPTGDTLAKNTFVLNEIKTAQGYIPLKAPVTITVDYFGDVTAHYDVSPEDAEDFDQYVVPPVTDLDEKGRYLLTINERAAVCKIKDGDTEHLFATLNDAVHYAEGMTDRTATIEMLKDYAVPEDDVVTIAAEDTITLTTAEKGVEFPYMGEGTTAIVSRGESGSRLFTVDGGDFRLNNVILDGTGSKYKGTSNGGLIYVDDGYLTVNGNTVLRNSVVNQDGGAIYLDSGAVATVTACTISANGANNGAGIYVSSDARLNISGNIDFGGTGVVGNTLSTTAGNFKTDALNGATNGAMAYPKGRQDIYLVEDGEAPATLYVTGELTGGDGTIWVWAQYRSHYEMMMPFAVYTPTGTPSEKTLHAFRNAREDSLTSCGGEYLTGQVGTEPNWIAWTGGVDVEFQKIDGYGDALSGAEFTLYTDQNCTTAYEHNGNAVKARSNEDGTVMFEKVSNGIYFMKETAAPTGYKENTFKYVVLVGESNLTVPENRTELWSTVLANITNEEIEAQRTAYNTRYEREITNYAIFQLDRDDHYLKLPNIAEKGIMNVSEAERPVILSNIDPLLKPLVGAKFTLHGVDEGMFELEDESFVSDHESGVFFCGLLPYGTYYLEQTQTPDGFQTPSHYFVFQVKAEGVLGFKRGVDGFAATNTITEATDDIYKIPTPATT